MKADPLTGRLTAVFDDDSMEGLPQVPFTSFELDFDDGPRAPLTSPAVCGPHTATTHMTPWSGNGPVDADGEFTLTEAPGGGGCPGSLGERPFAPGFLAGRESDKAGAFTPFRTDIGRSDGEQELKGADVELPPGMTARLAGIEYCPERRARSGGGKQRRVRGFDSSCPISSLVGGATVRAGTGSGPIAINGRVFLTGPYDGAPLSLAIVTPAMAGPFDLGSVVVRVALLRGSRNRPGSRCLGRDTARLRRRPARCPIGLRAPRSTGLRPQPDELLTEERSKEPSSAAAPTRPIRLPSPPSRNRCRSR